MILSQPELPKGFVPTFNDSLILNVLDSNDIVQEYRDYAERFTRQMYNFYDWVEQTKGIEVRDKFVDASIG